MGLENGKDQFRLAHPRDILDVELFTELSHFFRGHGGKLGHVEAVSVRFIRNHLLGGEMACLIMGFDFGTCGAGIPLAVLFLFIVTILDRRPFTSTANG